MVLYHIDLRMNGYVVHSETEKDDGKSYEFESTTTRRRSLPSTFTHRGIYKSQINAALVAYRWG